MKKFFKYLFNNKILIIILLLVAFTIPGAIVKEAQGQVTAIITGVGIDKADDNFNVSLQTLTSHYAISPSDSLEIVEDSGRTLGEAIDKLSFKLGKTMGFEHCVMVIIADSVATTENCKDILDFLYRRTNITLNTFLVNTNGKAKDLLIKSIELNNASGSGILHNLDYNQKNFNTPQVTTLGLFFNSYYSKSNTRTVYFIEEITPDDESELTGGGSGGGGSSSNSSSDDGNSGEQSSGSSGSGGTKPPERQASFDMLNNRGKSAIFQNGKKIDLVEEDVTRGINWLLQKAIVGAMILENVVDDKFYDGDTVMIKIKKGKTSSKAKIKDNKPIMETKISLCVEIVEINQKINRRVLENSYQDFLTPTLKERITEKINEQLTAVENYCHLHSIDVCELNNKLSKYDNKKYKEWLKTHSQQELLENLKIESSIKICLYN